MFPEHAGRTFQQNEESLKGVRESDRFMYSEAGAPTTRGRGRRSCAARKGNMDQIRHAGKPMQTSVRGISNKAAQDKSPYRICRSFMYLFVNVCQCGIEQFRRARCSSTARLDL